MVKQNNYAIVAITKHGVEIARRLSASFPDSDVYYKSKFVKGDEQEKHIQLFSGSVQQLLPALFSTYKGLILIVSLGAVVRMIAPLLKDKRTDPAVVVIDDCAEHAISVLSGHLGNANELTRKVAHLLGAKPVITTASDVQKTIAVDLFGKHFGWVPESTAKFTPVSAAVINEETVAIIQESGEKNWWEYDHPMPPTIQIHPSIASARKENVAAALVITHRELTEEEYPILQNGIIYRPKVIVLGIGCNRGTEAAEIETVIRETLAELAFSEKSVKAICTIDIKKDELGLLEVVQKNNWEFICYTPQQLNEVPIAEKSATVFKYTGAYGVSEPAARIYSKAEKLALVKKKSGNVTISVGVISY